MSKPQTVTLLILTLNEVDGVKLILPQIDQSNLTQLLILDGGSTDGTIEWVKQNGYELLIQSKPGIRFAYLESLPIIRGDIIVSFSPDGNCPLEGINLLIKKILEGYDLVIASRYFGNAKSDDDDFLTAFGNWLFNKTVKFLHGGNLTDVMVIFRAFKKQLIFDLDLDKEESYRSVELAYSTIISWEPLMSVRAIKSGKKICEIPMDEPKRIAGKRKLQIWRWGAAYFSQFWLEVIKWKSKKLS